MALYVVGIGYFTLPYLVHTGAAHVYACEWNRDAVEALRRSLVINSVADRCTVLYGDNRQARDLVVIILNICIGLLRVSVFSKECIKSTVKWLPMLLDVGGTEGEKKQSTHFASVALYLYALDCNKFF